MKTGLNILLGEDRKTKTNINANFQKTKLDISLIENNINLGKPFMKKLLELSNSIKHIGQIVPIIVREHPENKNRYIVVAGERRWRASKMAELKTIDVIISDKMNKIRSCFHNRKCAERKFKFLRRSRSLL